MLIKLKTKKLSLIFSAILIFVLGLGIGFELGRSEFSQNENVNEERNEFVGEFEVARVIDGDTIEISGRERVRYIGIDTPETVESDKPVECFGPQASAENKKLVEGKVVRLQKDLTDRDKYGRLLRYVWVDDIFVNLELVRLGFARANAYPPDTLHQNEISKAQEEAKKIGAGLWTACGEK